MHRFAWIICAFIALPVLGCAPAAPTPEISSVTLSKTTVAPGEEVEVTVKVKNFKIVAHDHGHGHDHGSEGEGHFHIHIDDSSSVISMGTSETHKFKMPDDLTDGEHTLRIELVKADHSTLEIKSSIKFTVKK